MKLGSLTWPEVEGYLKGKKNLIIPVGTCEQHGKHLPLDTDIMVAESVANYLSEETGILVAPTINYGVNAPADKHMYGTCSTNEGTLRGYLSSILEWWELQGFERFYLLSYHGDPFHIKALKKASPKVKVLELYDVDVKDILEKQDEVMHACECETSVMLYLYPEAVKMGKAEDIEVSEEVSEAILNHKEISLDYYPGNLGFPTYATKEKGEEIYSRMKKHALEWIKK